MKLTVEIPDDIAQRLNIGRSDLSRRILEEFKGGHIIRQEMRRLLGFATGEALDGFLRAHDDFEEYTAEDLEQEHEGLRRLGL